MNKWFTKYVDGVGGPNRKSIIAETNAFFPHAQQELVETLFVGLLELEDAEFLKSLSACSDGPSTSFVTAAFQEWVESNADPLLDRLVNMLSEWTRFQQSDVLMICRLIQSISHLRGCSPATAEYRNALLSLLANHHDESLRDVTTQAGCLLCLHFPGDRFDRPEWKPMPRMSVMRGVVVSASEIDVASTVRFYLQFTSSVDGMDLHYAVQSLILLINRAFPKKAANKLSLIDGQELVDMCMFRWEHTWQMVASNCRALFASVCAVASPDLLGLIYTRTGQLERGSKKRFNVLFTLVSAGHTLACDMEEILGAVRTSSPSVRAACQLLQAMFETAASAAVDRMVSAIVPVISATAAEIDMGQLFSAIAKANLHRRTPGCVSPVRLLVKQVMAHSNTNRMLLWKLVQSGSDSISLSDEGICIDSEPVFRHAAVEEAILSCDSELATVAIVALLRYLTACVKAAPAAWSVALVERFIIDGGIITVGCCSDDRSIVLHEMKRFFDRRVGKVDQASLFALLCESALRPAALFEETQLPMDIVSGVRIDRLAELIPLERREGFVSAVINIGLTSRWRKLRISCRSLVVSIVSWAPAVTGEAYKRFTDHSVDLNEELAGAMIDSAAELGMACVDVRKGPISNPDVFMLTALANADSETVKLLFGGDNVELTAYLMGVMVYFAQFVGENATSTLLTVSEGLLSVHEAEIVGDQFQGSVDCRGHPIMANDADASALSIKSWTCSKAAALALKALVDADRMPGQTTVLRVTKMIAVLLLSVKHPAEIAPLEVLFGGLLTKLDQDTVERDLLLPLIGSITGAAGSVFVLPVALRRSQGLGPLISAIVRTKSSLSLMAGVVERLLSIVNLAQDEEESVLHALNVLRCIVRDSALVDTVIDPFVGEIMCAGIDVLFRLSAEFWRVRSSATQLFVQAARRFIGTDNEEDWIAAEGRIGTKSRKVVTANEFFFNRTKDGELLFEEVVGVMSNADSEYVLVPILSVLQSLSRMDELAVSSTDGSALITIIIDGLKSKSTHVRRLSAKIVARMIVESKKSVAEMVTVGACGNWNEMHGQLMLVKYLAHLLPHQFAEGEALRSLLLKELEAVWSVPDVPELVANELVGILVRFGWGRCLESPSRVMTWIATLDSADVEASEAVALVVLTIDNVQHPIYRELVVAAVNEFPELVSGDVVRRCLTRWLESGYGLGIASAIHFMHSMQLPLSALEQEAIAKWIKSINVLHESLHEDAKCVLAKSEFFRSSFPDLWMLLLTDESAEVRMSASHNGANALVSFRHVSKLASSEALLLLLQEPLHVIDAVEGALFGPDSTIDYCLRYHPRIMAADALVGRGFVLTHSREVPKTPGGEVSHDNFYTVQSLSLLSTLSR